MKQQQQHASSWRSFGLGVALVWSVLLADHLATASYITMSNVRGDVNQGDCYSIERTFQGDFADATTGCVPQEINYIYANGGWDNELNVDTGYPLEVYARVKITITSACNDPVDNPDTCEITVQDVGTCNACSYDGDQDKITMADCSNLEGVFPSGTTPSVKFEYDGDSNPYNLQFFPLAYDEDRCNHPALSDAVTQEPYYPTSIPSQEPPSLAPFVSSYTEVPDTTAPTVAGPTTVPSGAGPTTVPQTFVPSADGTGSGTINPFFDVSVDVQDACLDGFVMATVKDSNGNPVVGANIGVLLAGVKSYEGNGITDLDGQYMFSFTVDQAETTSGEALWCSIAIENPGLAEYQQVPCSVQVCTDYSGATYAPSMVGPSSVPSGAAPSQIPLSSSPSGGGTSVPTSSATWGPPTTVPTGVGTGSATGFVSIDPFYDVLVNVQDACLDGYVMATVKDSNGNPVVGADVGVLLAGIKSYESVRGTTDEDGQYMFTFTLDPVETTSGEALWCSIAIDNPAMPTGQSQQVPCSVEICTDYSAATYAPSMAGPSSVPSGAAPSQIPFSSSPSGGGTSVPTTSATWGPPSTVPSGAGSGSGTVDPFYDVLVNVQDACLDGYVMATVKDSNGNPVVGADVGVLLAGIKSYEGGGKTDEDGQYMFTFTVDQAETASGEALWCSIAIDNPAMPTGQNQQVPCSVQVCTDYAGATYAPSMAGPSSVPSGAAPSQIPFSSSPAGGGTSVPTTSATWGPPSTVPSGAGSGSGTVDPFYDVSVDVQDACLDGYVMATVKDTNGNPVVGADVGVLLAGIKSYEGGGKTDEDGQYMFTFTVDQAETASGEALWCSIAIDNPAMPTGQNQQVPCSVQVCTDYSGATYAPSMAGPSSVPSGAAPSQIPFSFSPSGGGTTVPTTSATWGPPSTVPSGAGSGSGTVDPFYDVSVDVQDACLDGYVIATVKDTNGNPVVGADVGVLLAGIKSYEGGGNTDEDGQYMFTFTVDQAETASSEALWCSIAIDNPAMPTGQNQQVPCSVQVCTDYSGATYAPSMAGPSSVPSGAAPSQIPFSSSPSGGGTTVPTTSATWGPPTTVPSIISRSSHTISPSSFQTGGPTSSYTEVPPTTVPTSVVTGNPYYDVSVEVQDACLDGYLVVTVKDSDGSPLSGVDVGILLAGVETYEGGGLTDEDGQFFYAFTADPVDATGEALWCSIAVANPGLPQDQQVPCSVAVCSSGYIVSQRPSSVSASSAPTMAGPTGVPATSEPTMGGPTELPYSSAPTMSHGITAPPTATTLGPTTSYTEAGPTMAAYMAATTPAPTEAVSVDTRLGEEFTMDDAASPETLKVGLDIYLFFFKDKGGQPDFYAVDQFVTNTADFFESTLMSDSSFSDYLLNVTMDDIKVEYSADSPDEAKVTMMANIIVDPSATATSHQAAALMSSTNLNKYIGHYVRFNPTGGKTALNGVKRVKVVVKDIYTGSAGGTQ